MCSLIRLRLEKIREYAFSVLFMYLLEMVCVDFTDKYTEMPLLYIQPILIILPIMIEIQVKLSINNYFCLALRVLVL